MEICAVNEERNPLLGIEVRFRSEIPARPSVSIKEIPITDAKQKRTS
jgi:hypothetical protein